ncbi:thioredoxin family protein [Lactiplantibacillus plantarum]|uniref:thioredoxin family protein n=1 Tax=Lactiplantibacillus plantarum TaxID=1590 RepID=UPI001AAF7834|nr:thioredoxin family protein [Lactiplantibacillus plantarum]MBO2705796.1 hypothetical protein [Lactiplantibacillus plantarum]MDN7038270.1 thioredoxin family protein [Lactiplantibacillus plantarum]MDO7795362.1 thioredoxin family protein [Lactiplantibacillus plantarum]WVI00466.1 thioredoxin family protein [Lactiplantibacillus plantarum]
MNTVLSLFGAKKYKERIKSSEHVEEVGISDFIEALSAGEPRLFLIGRPTCSECRSTIKDIIKSVEDQDIHLSYINTDEIEIEKYRELFKTFKIEYLPDVLWICGKNKVKSMTVYHPESAIQMWLSGTVSKEG